MRNPRVMTSLVLGVPEVERIIYLYITLDGLLVPYSASVNEEILNNVQKRLDLLNKAWEAQEPPECLCLESHPLWKSVMQFCNYRNGPGPCCDKGIWEKHIVKNTLAK